MSEYIKRSDAIIAVTRAKLPDTTPDGVPIANGKRSVTDCVRRIKEIPAVQLPRWISVKERLPQEHEMVLAYCAEDDFYYISRMHKSFEDYEVTHWMPLHTPPKEDEA